MSQLYFTENGNVVPTLCEELTTYRRARKVLRLPATAAPATLYVLASPHAGSDLPLRVSVNDTEMPPISPHPLRLYLWYEVSVEPSLLRPGVNTLEFWTDATAMNAWSLGVEAGHAQPESAISDDGGQTWRSERMGYLNVLRGEYLVRVRLAEGEDPPPPPMVWEDPANPRMESLRRILPEGAASRQGIPLLKRVRALTSWLSASWEHTNSNRAAQYAPWDAETILAWGGSQTGHNGRRPIVMCVHYGAAFVSCCQAVGIPARCAVFAGPPDRYDGHFVAEVWFEEHGKWVMVDPNLDAILWKGGAPLSVREIQETGAELGGLIEWGPGLEYQKRNPHIMEWLETSYLTGLCFQRRSIWPRADLLSRPELSPPGHGSTAYCETGLVWESRERESGLGMFPYFADASYFDAPPGG